jgi:energy-converting hydrogenase Eha subunit A
MTNRLPIKAKVMIGMVAVASLCALSFGVVRWQAQAWPQLMLLVAAAALSSRLKVKLPGITSSMSGNLPVILLGVTQLGLFASLLVAVTAAVAQSYSSDRSSGGNKTKPIQFVFNACTLLNATGLAYLVYHSQVFGANATAHTISLSLVLAAATYFLANTVPIASIIGLTEGGHPFALWHKVFLWSFPNYVIGAGLTAIASTFGAIFGTISGLATLAALLAVLFAVYRSYKMYVGRAEQPQPKAMAMASGQ